MNAWTITQMVGYNADLIGWPSGVPVLDEHNERGPYPIKRPQRAASNPYQPTMIAFRSPALGRLDRLPTGGNHPLMPAAQAVIATPRLVLVMVS